MRNNLHFITRALALVVPALFAAVVFSAPAAAKISANHSAGAVIVGADTADTCASGISGAMRYNATSNLVEYCNGTAWQSLGTCGGATFAFSNVGGAQTSTLITSNTVTVSGFTGTENVSISGSGSPAYSINGGSFTNSAGTISSGQTLQLELTSFSSASTAYSASVTVGSATVTWMVTTASKIVFYLTAATEGSTFAGTYGGGRTGADGYCNAQIPSGLTCKFDDSRRTSLFRG